MQRPWVERRCVFDGVCKGPAVRENSVPFPAKSECVACSKVKWAGTM